LSNVHILDKVSRTDRIITLSIKPIPFESHLFLPDSIPAFKNTFLTPASGRFCQHS